MPGATDRATDEHWSVVTAVNDAIADFNEVLHQHDAGGHRIEQAQFIGSFTVEDVQQRLEYRRMRLQYVVDECIEDEEAADELKPHVDEVNTILTHTSAFD